MTIEDQIKFYLRKMKNLRTNMALKSIMGKSTSVLRDEYLKCLYVILQLELGTDKDKAERTYHENYWNTHISELEETVRKYWKD